MAKFIVAFGAGIVTSIDIIPVTNAEHVQSLRSSRNNISEQDRLAAAYEPNDMHRNATYERAKSMCDGYTSLSFA